jgi:hypothetical protein
VPIRGEDEQRELVLFLMVLCEMIGYTEELLLSLLLLTSCFPTDVSSVLVLAICVIPSCPPPIALASCSFVSLMLAGGFSIMHRYVVLPFRSVLAPKITCSFAEFLRHRHPSSRKKFNAEY